MIFEHFILAVSIFLFVCTMIFMIPLFFVKSRPKTAGKPNTISQIQYEDLSGTTKKRVLRDIKKSMGSYLDVDNDFQYQENIDDNSAKNTYLLFNFNLEFISWGDLQRLNDLEFVVDAAIKSIINDEGELAFSLVIALDRRINDWHQNNNIKN